MNLLTRKHLDFYYKKLLEIETRKAEADKVSVILSLNKGVNEYFLEKGESLLAVIPGKAEKEIRAQHLLSQLPDAVEMAEFVTTVAGLKTVSGQVFAFESRLL